MHYLNHDHRPVATCMSYCFSKKKYLVDLFLYRLLLHRYLLLLHRYLQTCNAGSRSRCVLDQTILVPDKKRFTPTRFDLQRHTLALLGQGLSRFPLHTSRPPACCSGQTYLVEVAPDVKGVQGMCFVFKGLSHLNIVKFNTVKLPLL